jgi:probable O-glycosylation ligase (exosortase A-associated)
LFALFGTLWVPFAANNFWAFQTATTQWLLLTAATVPMSLLLVAPARRRQYLAFWIFMNAYLALFVIANGGRGPGGIMEDENDMAFTFCMAIPYPFFLAQCSTNKPLVRGMYYGITLLMLAAVVATHSRGGFLGVACVAAYGIYLSRNRLRKILVLITIGVVALQFVPDSYFDRIGSISDTSDSSRVERLKSWRIGWNIFVDNPVLGVGPSNYGTHSPPYHMALPDYVPGEPLLGGRAAHSLYFTLLPEGGLVGAGIYAMLIIGLFRGLRQSERIASSAVAAHSEAESDLLLARAARASLIGYLAAGAFISILYYPHLWYTIGIVIALSRDVRRRYGQHHAPASTTLRRSPVKA